MPIKNTLLLMLLFSMMPYTYAQDIGSKTIKPELKTLQNYKDWVVGCDNIKTCHAVLLKPEINTSDGLNASIIKGISDKPFLHINIYNLDILSDDYQIVIDGRIIATTIHILEDETLRIIGKDALKLADAMARGYKMTLLSSNRKEQTISLAGTMATMLYIDAQQKTYDTNMAIIARGSKAYQANFIRPKIIVSKIDKLYDMPNNIDISALSQSSGCAEEQFRVDNDRVYSMGKDGDTPIALVIISCGNGAYNFSSALYLGRLENEKWSFEPAGFDYDDAIFTSETGAMVLINVDWDKDTQILSSFHKGRGLGDCGITADYVWDGQKFRLINFAIMDPCRGAWEWITLWQAQPVFKQ